MFGWFKKRLLSKMNTFVYMARMVTALAALEHVGIKSAGLNRDADKEAMKAAAMTNYLFSETPAAMHKQQLDLHAEHEAAIAWLQEDPTFRELVVQSLRVMTTANYGSGKGASVVGEEILALLGAEYPQAPEPATYEALVMRAIQTLPVKAQVQFSRWAKSQGR